MIAVPECINKRPKEFNFTVSSSFPFESVPQPFEQVPSFWLQPEKTVLLYSDFIFNFLNCRGQPAVYNQLNHSSEIHN